MHFYRNGFTVTPSGKVKEVAAMLKVIHAQEDRTAADVKAQQVIEKLVAMELGKASRLRELEQTTAAAWRVIRPPTPWAGWCRRTWREDHLPH